MPNHTIMPKKFVDNYQVEDFVTDESFLNYYFKLNTDDQLFWEEWLGKFPTNKPFAVAAIELLQTLSLTLSEDEFLEELAKIKAAIGEGQPAIKKVRPSLFRFLQFDKAKESATKRKSRTIKTVATSLLVLFVGGYFLLTYFTKSVSQLTEKFNYSNTPVVFVLSDSTVVTLAPQSGLHYPTNFNEKERKVYLEGEAQFHVKRDSAHPFKVYSAEVVATVLGTVFNIKQHAGDSIVQVELLKGKLQVETINSAGASTQSIILNPDERVVFNRHQQKLYKESWQQNNKQPSITNHFKFSHDNFETIAKQIKTVFGIKLVNQSNKEEWRFTGEFNNNSAKEIIENICIVKKLNYQIQGDTIFIK